MTDVISKSEMYHHPRLVQYVAIPAIMELHSSVDIIYPDISVQYGIYQT